MSECILMKRKAASIPFYIESVSLNLYSAEELCYFIANYIPLAEEIITDKNLVKWLDEECSMPGTADIIRSLLTGRDDTREEALKVILKNTYYYSASDLEQIFVRIDEFRDKREADKRMARAAVLMKNKKYKSAMFDYESILAEPEISKESDEFRGRLYYNLGCACAKIFQLGKARRYFENAMNLLSEEKVRRADLAAAYLYGGVAALDEEANRIGAGIGEKNKVLSQIEAFQDPVIKEDLEVLAARWMKEYHESMGL